MPEVVFELPRYLDEAALAVFVDRVVRTLDADRPAKVFFDFRTAFQADSLAFVVLSNLIERAAQQSTKVAFLGLAGNDSARSQLASDLFGENEQIVREFDRARFFLRYLGRSIFSSDEASRLTLPLHFIEHQGIAEYLLNRLVPFVSRCVDMSGEQLDSFRACTEEIFQNVKDHSGVSTGCAYASLDMSNRFRIAVSDFGIGIPNEVRTKEPHLDVKVQYVVSGVHPD